MRKARGIAGLLSISAVFMLVASLTAPHAGAQSSDGWVGGADSDEERFRLIERDLGGFGRSMWEVGERWERLYQALADENWELASHHWDGIRAATERGIVRRPGRAENARAELLDTVWEEVRADIESGDGAQAWAGFEKAREACMSCHEAEDRDYLNRQPMFEDLRAP